MIAGHFSGRINRLLNDISTAEDEQIQVYVLSRNGSHHLRYPKSLTMLQQLVFKTEAMPKSVPI